LPVEGEELDAGALDGAPFPAGQDEGRDAVGPPGRDGREKDEVPDDDIDRLDLVAAGGEILAGGGRDEKETGGETFRKTGIGPVIAVVGGRRQVLGPNGGRPGPSTSFLAASQRGRRE
jgi:hypothetical protein